MSYVTNTLSNLIHQKLPDDRSGMCVLISCH